MDFLNALEDMADRCRIAESYGSTNIERWMKLFGLTYQQAEKAIESHLEDVSRLILTNEQWALLRDKAESEGHDRESYAYSLSQRNAEVSQPPAGMKKKKSRKQQYILRLEDPLDTPEKVQKAANFSDSPNTFTDDEDMGVPFVVLDAASRTTIGKLPQYAHLTFIPIPMPAEKELSDISISPTLGIDAILPQKRGIPVSPLQDQYPVSYFFYGTLAEPDRLSRILGLQNEPVLKAATICRGKLKMWGQYRALIDGDDRDRVDGWMYVVENKEHEDTLRAYETCNYEVVRCDITLEGEEAVKGLTFRFCGT